MEPDDTPRTEDQKIADRVHEACNELTSAVWAAKTAGLRVELTVSNEPLYGNHAGDVSARVSKLL